MIKGHIDELDGLRGVAALVVVIAHCANVGFLPDILSRGLGQQGVALFYLLSGFLMAHLYLDRTFSGRNVAHYAVARGARVLPLFYAAVALATVAWLALGKVVYKFDTLPELMGNVFLLQGTSVLWSIPVEIQFYVIFVGLWWMCSQGYHIWQGLALLCALQGMFLALTDIGSFSLPYWLHFFTIGVAATALRPQISVPRWFAIAVLCALPFAIPGVRRHLDMVVLPNYRDPITAGYPILIFLLVLWKSEVFRFLAHPVLRYLGQISFGVYLIHMPVILVIYRLDLNGVLASVLVTALTLLAASASLYLYERPVQRLLRARLTYSGTPRHT